MAIPPVGVDRDVVDPATDDIYILGGHGFTTDQPVKYYAPDAMEFNGDFVDVKIITINPNDSPDQGPFLAPVWIMDLGVADHRAGNGITDIVRISTHQGVHGQQRPLPHSNGQQGQGRALFITPQVTPGNL